MKKKYRIGIDARMFGDQFTGIGRYTYELTRRLFELEIPGVEIEWVLFLNDPAFSQYDFPRNVKKFLVNAPQYSFSEQLRFVWKLYRENCDLVHFTHFNVPLLFRGKAVVTIHDTTLSFFPGAETPWYRKFIYQIVIRNALWSAQKIISISQNTSRDIQNLFGTAKQKISTIWNGLTDEFRSVSETEKQKIRGKYELSDTYLFYCGVWKQHKNIPNLIKSFASVVTGNSAENLQLVLTGTPTAEGLDLISDFGLDKSVKLLGKVPFEDLVLLMGAATAFVFPSKYEGFGLPPLEAMRAEVPVLASNVSAIPEVCGEAALYFDPNDVADMAKKSAEILSNESLRSDLVAKGKSQTQKFDWHVTAEKVFAVYREVLGMKN